MSVSKGDKLFGVWLVVCGVLGFSWLIFMGWLLYTVVEWGVHK